MAGKNKPVKKKAVRAKTKVKSVRARRPDTAKRVRRHTTRVRRRRRIDARILRAQRRNATMFKKMLFDPFGIVLPQGVTPIVIPDPIEAPAPVEPATNADYHNYIQSMETASGWHTQPQKQTVSSTTPPGTPPIIDLLLKAVGHIFSVKGNLP